MDYAIPALVRFTETNYDCENFNDLYFMFMIQHETRIVFGKLEYFIGRMKKMKILSHSRKLDPLLVRLQRSMCGEGNLTALCVPEATSDDGGDYNSVQLLFRNYIFNEYFKMDMYDAARLETAKRDLITNGDISDWCTNKILGYYYPYTGITSLQPDLPTVDYILQHPYLVFLVPPTIKALIPFSLVDINENDGCTLRYNRVLFKCSATGEARLLFGSQLLLSMQLQNVVFSMPFVAARNLLITFDKDIDGRIAITIYSPNTLPQINHQLLDVAVLHTNAQTKLDTSSSSSSTGKVITFANSNRFHMIYAKLLFGETAKRKFAHASPVLRQEIINDIQFDENFIKIIAGYYNISFDLTQGKTTIS